MKQTQSDILQKFDTINRSLFEDLGEIVNQKECQEMLQFLEQNKRMLHPNVFYLVVDNKQGIISWSLNLFKYFGYPDISARDSDLKVLEVLSWIKPEELPIFLSNGISVYKEAEKNPQILTSYSNSASYHIEVHMKDYSGNYFHLLQQAIPLGIDKNSRLVSHLNIYTIIADGYRPNVIPLSKVYIESSQGVSFNKNLQKNIPMAMSDFEVLDFNQSHQQIIDAYKLDNSLTVPQLVAQLKLSENSIRKYQKDILQKINKTFGMSFTSLKPALKSLFISKIL